MRIRNDGETVEIDLSSESQESRAILNVAKSLPGFVMDGKTARFPACYLSNVDQAINSDSQETDCDSEVIA